MHTTARYRFPLYFVINLSFALLVGIASGVSEFHSPRPLYLILLFALCSTAVIDLDGVNGRRSLLAMFMLVYFVSFGVGDLSNILSGGDLSDSVPLQSAQASLTSAEVVILVGGIMLAVGYRFAMFVVSARGKTRNPRDWSKVAILTVGLVFWAIGTIATYRWYIYVVPDTTNAALRKGLASVGSAAVTAYLLGIMCQPLGMLLIAYAFRVYRNSLLLALVIVMVCLQLLIGFVADTKGLAMLGIILVVITGVLIDGRVPKSWLAVGVVFVTLIYPYFTAYRAAIHGAGIARTTVIANFGEILQKTFAAKERVNTGRDRAMTFLERSNVKPSVEVIVEKAGTSVEFQHGYTLGPILAAFVPKILWSDKRWIPTGQLFNQSFKITDSDDVFISPSHLGELYWNFGWPGVVWGMGLIGFICGCVGAQFNLAEYRTVTRLLVTVITIRQLIVSFESSISDCYVVWLRSLVSVGIVHIIFARVPSAPRSLQAGASEPDAPNPDRAPAERLFPNLLT